MYSKNLLVLVLLPLVTDTDNAESTLIYFNIWYENNFWDLSRKIVEITQLHTYMWLNKMDWNVRDDIYVFFRSIQLIFDFSITQ